MNNDLTHRLERAALARFDGDRVKALRYLYGQRTRYAHKADRMRGTSFHQQWQMVYKAYSSASFRVQYWLEVEQEVEQEQEQDEPYCEPEGVFTNQALSLRITSNAREIVFR
jgi:hypothetical protein